MTELVNPRLATSVFLSRSNIAAQFAWYLLVGGLAFLADLIVFVVLLKFGITVLVASGAGFFVGTVTNYWLSLALAFTGGRYRRSAEIGRTFAVALVGLGLTTFLIWAFIAYAGLSPVIAKLITVPIVFSWNFFGRRLFVFHSEMPVGTWRLSKEALARAARSTSVTRGRRT